MSNSPSHQLSSPAGQANSNKARAIIMTRGWEYRDQRFAFGRTNPVPDKYKRDGVFRLLEKDEGFLLAKDPKNEWGLGEFLREGVRIKVMVPMNRIRVGAPVRSFEDKLSEGAAIAPLPVGSIDVGAGTCLERYVRSFWVGIRQQANVFQHLGMRDENTQAVFSDQLFVNNVNVVLSGFTPPARSLLEHGHFSASDLVGLRKLEDDWPPKDLWAVYLLVYTHQDDAHANVDDLAIYAGQSTWLHRRAAAHREAVAHSQSAHYVLARRSPPNHRHMIPIILLDPSAIGGNARIVLNMAEQTAMSMFNAYHKGLIKSDNSPPAFAVSKSRYAPIKASHDTARQLSGWPRLVCSGCNVTSPLFGSSLRDISPTIYCYRHRANDPDFKPFTTYRCAINMLPSSAGAVYQFLWRRTDGEQEMFRFYLNHTVLALHNLTPPLTGYLVFEVMQNGQPHPRPWMQMPSVGPFQQFSQANSVGVRFEFLRRDQGKWFSCSIPMGSIRTISSMWKEGIEAPTFAEGREAVLKPWRKAMTLIQLLEGITFTGPLNGFEKRAFIATRQVLELENDHINQRARWVLRREQSRPAPAKATWEYNVDLVMREFNTEHTLITRDGPPDITEPFWSPTEHDVQLARGPKRAFCDVCKFSYTPSNQTRCERDPNRTDVWVCKCCSLMGKPCTFTPPSVCERLWGTERPWTEPENWQRGYSQNPTGPFKTMTYNHPKTECFEVPEPFGGMLGLQLADIEEEESDMAER
ncbi:hypothetical protein LRP88_02213 [Fusarium phalaenopsidis]